MNYQKTTITLLILILVGIGTALWSSQTSTPPLGRLTDRDCTVSTVTAVAVGDDISTTVLSASSRRAYAKISAAPNAVDTVYLSFDEGSAATVANGLPLTSATTTSPVSGIEFGLNTSFPYTGAVTAITSTASTTVLLTQCNY